MNWVETKCENVQKTFHGLHTIKITIKNVLYGEVAYDVINSKHCWFLDKNIMYKFSLTNILTNLNIIGGYKLIILIN